MVRGNILIAGIAALTLVSCGPSQSGDTSNVAEAPQPSVPASAPGANTGSPAPVEFAVCSTCHAVEKDKNGIGPSLFAIVGTKAGEVPGFNFSPAMKASALTWDDATLDKFIENPYAVVPGTKMPFAGIKEPAKRAKIIEYLKTLK